MILTKNWEMTELISIHSPAKGETKLPEFITFNEKFQSTHPRRVRQESLHRWRAIHKISIHSPAKGETRISARAFAKFSISIHSPAKGETSTNISFSDTFLSFQSTHPRRVRHFAIVILTTRLAISIHSPAKGETNDDKNKKEPTVISIHSPAKGETVHD